MFNNWNDLLDDAFCEAKRTFFYHNKGRYLSDAGLINAIYRESLIEQKGVPARVTELCNRHHEAQWLYDFLIGYDLHRWFGKEYTELALFCRIMFAQLLRDKTLALTEHQMTGWQHQYGGVFAKHKLSAFSKVLTLRFPLHYWMYDRRAQTGLKTLLKRNREYSTHEYPAFKKDLDELWWANKQAIMAYAEKNTPERKLDEWKAPPDLDSYKLEVIARRFLDKILMSCSEKGNRLAPLSGTLQIPGLKVEK